MDGTTCSDYDVFTVALDLQTTHTLLTENVSPQDSYKGAIWTATNHGTLENPFDP